ncbi:hypothetical protein ABEB36_010225 [Hypothenemus hampei]|uniref:Uncharacterized protein n=1 Tax=Hypothenemus hampei TaxID=57062 RepID=A0ABD1EIY0_HYPHA
MAGNYGKYIDRSPTIYAAGKVSGDPTENVLSCLNQYRLVDEIEALQHDAKIYKAEPFVPLRKLPVIQNPAFRGTQTEIRELLNPPLLTRYQQLIQDLKETPYFSYWNAEIGKVRDYVPGLPAGMNPVETTYGQPSKKDITVKELINPSKGVYEVLRESQLGHDLYKKTHNDYNPSEQMNRGYKKPPFDPKKCYGFKTKYDPRGIGVRCAIDWSEKEPLMSSSKLQADFLRRTRPQLGKVLAPNDNISCVPKGHRFGNPLKRHSYEVADLLRDPTEK